MRQRIRRRLPYAANCRVDYCGVRPVKNDGGRG